MLFGIAGIVRVEKGDRGITSLAPEVHFDF